jgi:hypothetical protein
MSQWFSFSGLGGNEAKQLDSAVDRRLRASVTPPAESPPWLHASIMNAVRQSAATQAEPGHRFPIAWALPLLLVTLAAGWFWLRPSTPWEHGMASGVTPASALPDTAWQSAARVVQPLDEELTNLARDWEKTTEFLLASLP